MAGDKTYITDQQGKQHRATRVHAVTPTNIVWSSNPNDYAVQVLIDGKWHRAILTYDVSGASYFDNVNIDKALVVGADGKNHTALIVSSEAAVTLSSIKTDEHALVNGTTTGETAVCTYTEAWGNIEWEDNVNVYKVIVTGSDGKKHTALLTTGAKGGVQAIVMGIAPLELRNAVAGEILSLTAFGGTSQGGFNAMGYTPLDYLESSGTQYIDTGIVGNKNTKIEVKWLYHTTSSAAGSGRVFGSRASSGPNRIAFGTNTGTVATTTFFWQFGSGNAVTSTGTDLELDTWYVITASRTIHNINGTDYGSPFSEETITTPQNIKLFGFDNAGTMACGIGRCAYCKIWDGDQIVRYFVPAKNSNGVVGMLDLVNMQFYQNAGTGGFAYGTEYVPTPDNPVALYCNNGEIKPTGNILDSNTSNISVGYYINRTTGEIMQSDANFMFSQYIPIQPSTSYVAYGRRRGDNLLSQYNRIAWYDANQNFISTANYTQNTIGKGTSPSNAAYMRLSVNPIGNTDPITIDTVLGFDWYIGKGNTEVPITPYSTIGAYADDAIETIETQDDQNTTVSTATCEILLSVGEYTDEQEVISGAITRKVGIKAFDGTESWSRASNQDGSANYVFYTQIDDKKVGNNQPMLCSHHKYIGSGSYVTLTAGKFLSNSANTSVYFDGGSITTATNWKNWLATQYANGTPVIVIYPLATETTETVTGQPMQTATGDNTAEITQAGMAGLQLEVTYMKEA